MFSQGIKSFLMYSSANEINGIAFNDSADVLPTISKVDNSADSIGYVASKFRNVAKE